MNRNIVAGAAVAVACVTAVTILSALHADTTAILSVIMGGIMPLLGAMLYGKIEAINQQTNGNTSRLISLVERQSNQLAAAAPPAPADPTGGE